MSEVKRFKAVINDKPYKPYAYCEENSDGIYVRHEDYAALQQKLDAVLAENVGLKKFITSECFVNRCGVFEDPEEHYFDVTVTDAILNAVRAEGASVVSTRILACLDEFPERVADILQECANIADSTASELRAGNSEGATHD